MSLMWFILGLGSELQIVASLSITEALVLCATPFIFGKEYVALKRDGIMPLFLLSVGVIVGCLVASIVNRSPLWAVIRGLAVTCLISCSIVYSHWIIRKNPMGFKWYLLGAAISLLLSTYMFKQSVEVSMYGESVEDIMGGATYWIKRLGAFLLLPGKGWYMTFPFSYVILAPLGLAAFSMLTSSSGRSAALGALGFVLIALIGRQKLRTMKLISRHFWVLCTMGIITVSIFHYVYRISATRGWLGEESQRKYELQSKGENSIGRLILGGRGDSFIGLLACRDKPIVGWGPWARDENGYTVEFLTKYGTETDIINLQKMNAYSNVREERLISCHSYITEFWVWYGVSGLIFMVYLLFVIIRYLKEDCYAVPQWFGWLACGVPSLLWGIFFSPFANRFGVPLFAVACLMARSVRLGSFRLPQDMIMEIEKANRK